MGFIREGTSKGNQSKFIKDGWFYKEDNMGYESISEALVSEFLSFIDGVEYIDYYLELVEKDGKSVECCKSKVYNTDNENFISVGKILKVYANKKDLSNLTGKALLDYVVDCVYTSTGVDIRDYLRVLTYIDSLILNEDRHFYNICLIEKDGEYRVAPVFDNGLSLLSDTSQDYRHGVALDILIRKVKCMPFVNSFDKQVKYFEHKPLVIDIDGFYKKLDLVDKNLDDYIPFKKEGYLRAKQVLLKRLSEKEGTLWVRKQ